MKKFNLNNYILVAITEYGWEEARKQVGQDYLDDCVIPNKQIVDDKVYYKIQAHQLITLFKNALWIAYPHPVESTILIPDLADDLSLELRMKFVEKENKLIND